MTDYCSKDFVSILACISNEKQEYDTYSFKASDTVNINDIIFFETNGQHFCLIVLIIFSTHFIQCFVFKRVLDCQKNGSYKSINSKDTMTTILLTLHIGLEKEIIVTLFLILLNSN